MTRKEMYAAIKADEKMLELARKEAKGKGINYTSLSNDVLEKIINKVKDAKKPCCKKTAPKTSNNKCVDDGARKAILAIAKILNLKNIEKNF